MIKLFPKKVTDEMLKTNGIAVLDKGITDEPVVAETKNGAYTLDFVYRADLKHANELIVDNVVVAPTPTGDQAFRIKSATDKDGYIDVACYHIFYDLADNLIEDSNFVSLSGTDMMKRFQAGFQYQTPFKFESNIKKIASARIVRFNPVAAILDSSKDNTFLNRWGGDLVRDNFNVKLVEAGGFDRGFKIKHGKNLTGYEYEIDASKVATRIMPYGFDGLMLPEKYVDSPLIDNEHPKIAKVDYNDVKADSGDADSLPLEEAYDKLRELAKNEFDVNNADKPSINIKVKFKYLGDTKEYSQFKKLENVKPWEVIHVEINGFNYVNSIIGYKFNPLTKQYLEVEIGNYSRVGITDKNNSTNDRIDEIGDQVENQVTEVKDDLNDQGQQMLQTLEDLRFDWDKKQSETQETIDEVTGIVDTQRQNLSEVMNSTGSNVLEFYPNTTHPTSLKIKTAYGYWLLNQFGGGFHSNSGTVLNGLSADGKIIATDIYSNTLTAININSGNFNGGTYTGGWFTGAHIEAQDSIGIKDSSGNVRTVISAVYGVSTPELSLGSSHGSINNVGTLTLYNMIRFANSGITLRAVGDRLIANINGADYVAAGPDF